ncbi:MAG: methionine gamma-lyase family protein [Firmicutes bacterium]|nr:methionine gamma-lyase family protein [Bacillota bacterium]
MRPEEDDIGSVLGVDDDLLALALRVRETIQPQLRRVEDIARFNTARVLEAFKSAGLGDQHFGGTTGYGYDDTGRDALERAFAKVFEAEAALVRVQIVSGTHALAAVMFGILRPGDLLVSAFGSPYDTMRTVIGNDAPSRGSLAEFGVEYAEVAPDDRGEPDLSAISKACCDARMVLVQRSRGYARRRALTLADIDRIAHAARMRNPRVVVVVDNCYGEFTDTHEPTSHGADIVAGSLIKNPGGGVAPAGGYIAGNRELVEMAAERLTAPGLGSHVGPSLGLTRQLALGLFLAPLTTAEAIAGSIFAAEFLASLGFVVYPEPGSRRSDIVLGVRLETPENVTAFCRAVQESSPVDASAVPEPAPMPGYSDQVVMAAGTFTQGASIELSADAPLRPPYDVYLQGGLSRHQVEFAMLRFAQAIRRKPRQVG